MKHYRKLYYMPGWDRDCVDNAIALHSFFWNSLKHILSPSDIRLLWILQAGHEERWLPDKHGLYYKDGRFVGTCFSSSMRYGTDRRAGCRVLKAHDVIGRHPKRWYSIHTDVNNDAFEASWWFMQAAIYHNQGYDTKDILQFFSPKQTQDITDGKFICSGVCYVFDHWKEISTYADEQKRRVRLISPTVSAFESIKTGGAPARRCSDGKIIAEPRKG